MEGCLARQRSWPNKGEYSPLGSEQFIPARGITPDLAVPEFQLAGITTKARAKQGLSKTDCACRIGTPSLHLHGARRAVRFKVSKLFQSTGKGSGGDLQRRCTLGSAGVFCRDAIRSMVGNNQDLPISGNGASLAVFLMLSDRS